MTPVALRSPCYSCHNYGQPGYPKCAESPCQLLNAYLVAQGLPPHEYPKNENLAELFPPLKRNRAEDLSNVEQCTQAREKVLSLRKTTGMQVKALAVKLGIPNNTLKAMMISRQKRISLKYYNLIMRYGD